jgi:hypothetical protein
MHSARIEKSKRLQSVDKALASGTEMSTRELIQATGMCAINSIISELRDNGKDIRCHRRGGAWYYQMIT